MDHEEQEYNALRKAQHEQHRHSHPHTSELVVPLHTSKFSYIPRGFHEHEYEDDLRQIIVDQIAQPAFIYLETLKCKHRTSAELKATHRGQAMARHAAKVI
ncbi:MAG: hypothetical protein ACYDER_03425 [Ktedonobacteraceae bacterium]